mmetsp:Transcript_8378/g.22672  ORF Transcript_8378/g.22672 Transcript_8378/m.22672 type:complete len:556 (-) Transcript_8378:747-2414(-)
MSTINLRSSQRWLEKLALGNAVLNSSSSVPMGSGQPGERTRSSSIDGTHSDPNDRTANHQDLETRFFGKDVDKRLGGFLHPRDMRKLVTQFSASNAPELIVRRHAMLLNFDPLRAIILRDRLLVLVPDGADSLLNELEKKVHGGSEHHYNSQYSSATGSEDVRDSTASFAQTESPIHTDRDAASDLRNSSSSSDSEESGRSKTGILHVNTGIDHDNDAPRANAADDARDAETGEGDGDANQQSKSKVSFAVPVQTVTELDPLAGSVHSAGGGVANNGAFVENRGSVHDEPEGSEEEYEAHDTDDMVIFESLVDSEWSEMDNGEWIDLPFELQSVDAVLHSVCNMLADEVEFLQIKVFDTVQSVLAPGSNPGDLAQEMLRHMKNDIQEMKSRVQGLAHALEMVLEDYEDMALMNLSRLLTHPDRYMQPVPQEILDEESDEPEYILESYLQRANTLNNSLALLEVQITSTEAYTGRKSDAIRNRLLYINMIFSIMSLCVTLASLVGSFFGMNVSNPQEDEQSAFSVIVFSTTGGTFILAVLLTLAVQRIGELPGLFS